MGLVIQNSVDVLPPVAEPAAAAGGAGASSSPDDGVFANLLASLATAVDAEATELSMDPAGLPGGETEGEDKEDATSALLAALFPMTTPLPLVKQPVVEVVTKDGVVGVSGFEGGTNEQAGEAALAAEALPLTEGVPTEAVGAPVADASVAIESQSAETPVNSAAVEPSPPAPLPIRTSRESGDESVRDSAPIDGAPPSEAGEAPATQATSVVRSVGNAETESETGDPKEKGRGKNDAVDGPRASTQGIAHAAANSAVGELRQAPAPGVESTQPAAEAPAPAPVELPQQVEQVAQTVIEQLDAGGGEARIHLDPVELGEVTIHVRTDGDSVSIEVRAERPEAAQLLRDHTQDLSQLLGSKGMNLSDVNVGLGRGNAGEAWGQDGRAENRRSNSEFANILGIEDSSPLDTHNRLRAAYNPDGAHMYRV